MNTFHFSFFVCLLCFVTAAIADESTAPINAVPLGIESLPNAYRVDERIISGGLPDGAAGFEALKSLGVRTVISVDGMKPDAETAREFGLCYVHLPHGYDGISQTRVLELAKAITDLPGPIYIHCHHGKHRSPAAAAAACITTGRMSHDDGQRFLTAAGTGLEYRGLYQTAQTAKPASDEQLRSLEVEFKESVPIPLMAAMMVQLEHTFDSLKSVEAAGWTAPKSHPDLSATHEALMLREHFAEMLRTPDVADRSSDFRDILRHSFDESTQLESMSRDPSKNVSQLSETMTRIQADCKSCHRAHRDND